MSNLLEKASILTTPTAYDDGKILSVKPNTSVGDFDFTRNSSATRVNSQGLIEDITSNLPRIDYSPYSGAGTCGHWLFEPQSTNLVTQSENFSSGWNLSNASIVSNSVISPDGNLNATLLKGNTNLSNHNIRRSGLTASVTGTYSVFAKAKELRYLQIASINTTNQYINFDLQDGLIGTVGSNFSNAKIEEFSDGWYRLSVTSDDRYNSFYISLVSGINSGWLETWAMSNNTDGLYIWGAQLEQSSFATSYIPTEGSIKTRLADAAFGSGSSDLINSTEGVLYAEVSLNLLTPNMYIQISDGTYSNRVAIINNNSSTSWRVFYRVNGSSQIDVTASGLNTFETNKIAISWKLNEFKFYVNGIKITQVNSGSVNPVNTFNRLEFKDIVSNNFYGKTKCVAVFKEALTDAELTCLTTI